MTKSTKLKLVVATLVAALSPLTLSPTTGNIVVAEACADGTCCPEDRSICFINDMRTNDAYRSTGSCIHEH